MPSGDLRVMVAHTTHSKGKAEAGEEVDQEHSGTMASMDLEDHPLQPMPDVVPPSKWLSKPNPTLALLCSMIYISQVFGGQGVIFLAALWAWAAGGSATRDIVLLFVFYAALAALSAAIVFFLIRRGFQQNRLMSLCCFAFSLCSIAAGLASFNPEIFFICRLAQGAALGGFWVSGVAICRESFGPAYRRTKVLAWFAASVPVGLVSGVIFQVVLASSQSSARASGLFPPGISFLCAGYALLVGIEFWVR